MLYRVRIFVLFLKFVSRWASMGKALSVEFLLDTLEALINIRSSQTHSL